MGRERAPSTTSKADIGNELGKPPIVLLDRPYVSPALRRPARASPGVLQDETGAGHDGHGRKSRNCISLRWLGCGLL
jgi:hypothetical protein